MTARRAELNPATRRPEPPLPVDAADDRDGTLRPELWTGPRARSRARALGQLLRWQPFLDLHERGPYPSTHAVRGQLCFLLDLLVRATIVGVMLFAALALAWKALAPIPPLFSK
jgi:hypothetical protein